MSEISVIEILITLALLVNTGSIWVTRKGDKLDAVAEALSEVASTMATIQEAIKDGQAVDERLIRNLTYLGEQMEKLSENSAKEHKELLNSMRMSFDSTNALQRDLDEKHRTDHKHIETALAGIKGGAK